MEQLILNILVLVILYYRVLVILNVLATNNVPQFLVRHIQNTLVLVTLMFVQQFLVKILALVILMYVQQYQDVLVTLYYLVLVTLSVLVISSVLLYQEQPIRNIPVLVILMYVIVYQYVAVIQYVDVILTYVTVCPIVTAKLINLVHVNLEMKPEHVLATNSVLV